MHHLTRFLFFSFLYAVKMLYGQSPYDCAFYELQPGVKKCIEFNAVMLYDDDSSSTKKAAPVEDGWVEDRTLEFNERGTVQRQSVLQDSVYWVSEYSYVNFQPHTFNATGVDTYQPLTFRQFRNDTLVKFDSCGYDPYYRLVYEYKGELDYHMGRYWYNNPDKPVQALGWNERIWTHEYNDTLLIASFCTRNDSICLAAIHHNYLVRDGFLIDSTSGTEANLYIRRFDTLTGKLMIETTYKPGVYPTHVHYTYDDQMRKTAMWVENPGTRIQHTWIYKPDSTVHYSEARDSKDVLIRSETNSYDKNGVLIRCEKTRKGDRHTEEVFVYQYDSHGNWISRDTYKDGVLVGKTRREITYF
jgi:hypothetical protein